jgi:8-oxo-dGTP diphosphatase
VTKSLHFVASALVVADEDVLLIFHRKLGRWLAPGGHIAKNETPNECAIREVAEETGIHAKLLDIDLRRHDYADAGVLLLPRPFAVQLEEIDSTRRHVNFVYGAVCDERTIRPDPREVVDARWMSPDDLADAQIPPNVRALGREILRVVRSLEGD